MSVATDKIRRWRESPILFVRECLGAEPDRWQAGVLEAFPTKNRLAMKACKGPGKTTVESWCALNFLATRPHPKIAATSITSDNLSDCLWPELAKWINRSQFLKQMFQWTKTRIVCRESPETWFMSARTWSKTADTTQQADTLAGLHSDYMLFILDEVGGFPDAVMAAAEAGLATGIETKILMGGNPTHTEGPLYRACTSEAHLWHVTEITGDPDDPNRSPRIDIKWAKDQIEKYGRDNPWVLVNVFGKFPPSSINTLLGPEEVREAMRRKYRVDVYDWSQKRLGIDVARFGNDRTCMFPRQGLQSFTPVTMRHRRDSPVSVDIANRAIMGKVRWGSELEIFDDTVGWAHGAIDVMRAAGHAPLAVAFHLPAVDARYKNNRAYMWFMMAEWIKKGGSLPNIPELVTELTTPTYMFNNGKFQLEDKRQIKDRMGWSPDLADSLCFVKNTLILTVDGKKEIKNISVDDIVITPFGNRKVLKLWKSEAKRITTVKFSNGSELKGKPEHKIFTWNEGWKSLDSLVLTDTIESDNKLRRFLWAIHNGLFMRDKSIGFKQMVNITSRGGKKTRRDFYTEGFIQKSLEAYQRVMQYIIKTVIGLTMPLKILNVLKLESINLSIQRNYGTTESTELNKLGIWTKQEKKQASGMVVKKEEYGIVNMEKRFGKVEKEKKVINVNIAENKSQLFSKIEQGFAQENVNEIFHIENIKQKSVNVLCAARNFLSINIGFRDIVPESVQTEIVSEETYNLTVEKDNVYYANGILVANCLTFAVPDIPKEEILLMRLKEISGGQNKTKHEFDPYDNTRG